MNILYPHVTLFPAAPCGPSDRCVRDRPLHLLRSRVPRESGTKQQENHGTVCTN